MKAIVVGLALSLPLWLVIGLAVYAAMKLGGMA